MENKKRVHDGTKILWHMDRVVDHFDRGKRVAPVHLDIGLSKYCNVSCLWCFGFFQDVKPVYIKKEALLQTIWGAHEIGVKSIAWVGDGEPTMNPHLYEALDYAKAYTNIDMAISTNGVLVNSEDKCDTILRSCKWMRFCIGAGTKEGYLKIHRKDYFDRVLKNIKIMLKVKKNNYYSCEIGLQTVFMPGIMDQETKDTAKMAVDLGVDYFAIKQYSVPDEGESGMQKADLNKYDEKETISALKYCENLSNANTEIIVKWKSMQNKGCRLYDGCAAVPFISEISGDGTWTVCGYMFGDKPEFNSYKFGNVHNKPLKEIFESDHYWEVIRKMRYDFDVHKQCKGACRLDPANKFCYDYLDKPSGINFL